MSVKVKQKLDVLIALLSYAGNGGVRTVLPEIAMWLSKTSAFLAKDERVGRVGTKTYGDVPLTMERNRIVRDAKEAGFDVIIMIDSDNFPDMYLDVDPQAKPFVESSFDFLYERNVRGVPTVVCGPYCGPPPHPVNGGEENVYVFYFGGNQTHEDGNLHGVTVEAYSREHAATMRGIQECAAGPTGCIMYSTAAFDLLPCHSMSKADILDRFKAGEISRERAVQLLGMESWFWYEFTDGYQTNKASTEDVTNTREIGLAGYLKYGEPVMFCNWDAWAGHGKPRMVGRPSPVRIEQVSELFAEAVRNNVSVQDERREIDFTEGLEDILAGDVDVWIDEDVSPDWSGVPECSDAVASRTKVVSTPHLENTDEPVGASVDYASDPMDGCDLDDDEDASDPVKPVEKVRIMGAVFESPSVGQGVCEGISRLLKTCDVPVNSSILVVGPDELAHSVAVAMDAPVYQCWTRLSVSCINGMSHHVKKLTSHIEVIKRMDRQDLGVLVVGPHVDVRDIAQVGKKHCIENAVIIVVDGPDRERAHSRMRYVSHQLSGHAKVVKYGGFGMILNSSNGEDRPAKSRRKRRRRRARGQVHEREA